MKDNQGRNLAKVKKHYDEMHKRYVEGVAVSKAAFEEAVKNVPLADWTDVRGIKVLRCGNSKFVAAPRNGKETAATYDIVDLEANEHVMVLKRNEVRQWLWSAAKAELETESIL